MINTFNESALHKTLKTFYALRENAETEVPVQKWVCDLVTPSGGIIEIQNKNVSALKEKITGLLERRVTVVHPIVREKIIELYSEEGKLISSRKSPKKESVYSMLRELTALASCKAGGAPLLLNRNFTLLCPEITVTEKRVQVSSPAQAKNGRRRFLKNWNKTDKALLTIGAEHKFSDRADYLSLLPPKLPEEFSSKEVRSSFIEQKNKSGFRAANLILWILSRMEIIRRVPHPGRAYYYRIS